ncbi:TPA: hypothetical protein ACGW3M_001112 [Pseudomonas aeruginosa]|uniref:hypothetical protein n=1 Tax=Pseudomonas aeruginosa TaxID=287 RepID=UPI0027ECA9E9|nr:hypothetical protein [Pseudomonas aeruginosa]ELJ2278775.1 hypothetical protein [Pseudomonas aeruginosa]
MQFHDIRVSREYFFSIGQELDSGKYYVSFPVCNGLIDYEEYYEIDREAFDRYEQDMSVAQLFVERCRRHEMDHLLLVPPQANRGTSV